MDDYYLDYFYGLEADAYSFVRVPKPLIYLPAYKDLSGDDKLLYGILLDRMGLSLRNNWFDEKNRAYIIFTIDDVMSTMNCAEHKAVKMLNNLENKAHLIERKRRGQGKPSQIYVKKFIPSQNVQFKNCINDNSGTANTAMQELSKAQCNNNDINNKKYKNTDSIIILGKGKEAIKVRKLYEDYFKESLETDYLKRTHMSDAETIDGIVELLIDICCSNREYVTIAGDDKPLYVVKQRLMKLNSSHIEYVLKCLSENTTRIRDIKQYLLAVLYNAPVTISPHYQSWVNNDMANGLI